MPALAEVPLGSAEFAVRFALATLANWRITHLLSHEDGPADVFVRLRRLVGSGFLASLMDCFNCLSVWLAAPTALFVSRVPLNWFITWLALSGASCLLQRIGETPLLMSPMSQSPEGKDHDVLRSETITIPE